MNNKKVINVDYLLKIYKKYSNELQEITQKISLSFSKVNKNYRATFSDFEGEILYCLIRDRKPKLFYEISPDCGYSTIYISSAFKKNKIGKIHEISLYMPQQALTSKRIHNVKDWRKKDKEIPTLHLDLVVHLLSILKFLFPRINIKKVNAKNLKIKRLTHTSLLWLETSDNKFVNIYASKYSLGDRNSLSIDIKGSNGRLKWEHNEPEILKYYDNTGTLSYYDRASQFLKISKDEIYNRYSAGHPYGFIEAISNYYIDIYRSLIYGQKIFDINDEHFIFDILNRSSKGKE